MPRPHRAVFPTRIRRIVPIDIREWNQPDSSCSRFLVPPLNDFSGLHPFLFLLKMSAKNYLADFSLSDVGDRRSLIAN